jgi:hypothetical protein
MDRAECMADGLSVLAKVYSWMFISSMSAFLSSALFSAFCFLIRSSSIFFFYIRAIFGFGFGFSCSVYALGLSLR